MLLQNRSTGAMVVVSNAQRRQRRLERRIRYWWRALDGHLGKGNVWMVTLTYRHDVDWEPRDITKFLRLVRDEGCKAYCWIAAVQPRTGRVHYHLLMVGSRPGWVDRRWGKGRTQVRPAWSPGYLLKYMWSQEVEGLPKGIRRFATWVRRGLLVPAAEWVYRRSFLPRWVDAIAERWGGLPEYEGDGWWDFGGYLMVRSEWGVYGMV